MKQHCFRRVALAAVLIPVMGCGGATLANAQSKTSATNQKAVQAPIYPNVGPIVLPHSKTGAPLYVAKTILFPVNQVPPTGIHGAGVLPPSLYPNGVNQPAKGAKAPQPTPQIDPKIFIPRTKAIQQPTPIIGTNPYQLSGGKPPEIQQAPTQVIPKPAPIPVKIPQKGITAKQSVTIQYPSPYTTQAVQQVPKRLPSAPPPIASRSSGAGCTLYLPRQFQQYRVQWLGACDVSGRASGYGAARLNKPGNLVTSGIFFGLMSEGQWLGGIYERADGRGVVGTWRGSQIDQSAMAKRIATNYAVYAAATASYASQTKGNWQEAAFYNARRMIFTKMIR